MTDTRHRIPVVLLVALFAATGCKKTEENQVPTASATAPETIDVGQWVQLDGSASSDPEDAALHRSWSFVRLPAASQATLNDPRVENPSFQADVAGEYVVSLVVDDGFLRSEPTTVMITANAVNQAPVATAGLDRNVGTGSAVLLDGGASYDPDGDELSHAWSFISKPSGSIASFDDPASAAPSFTADLDGDYQVRLVVSDGQVDSEPAEVVVNASLDNLAPIAEAGVGQSVDVGTLVTLDGAASFDPNGSMLTHTWTFTERPLGSATTLAQDGSPIATFTPDLIGRYVVALVVDDGTVTSAPDEVAVLAGVQNIAPVANAGTDQSVFTGAGVVLDGSGSSDADGDLLTYLWSFWSLPAGANVALNDRQVVSPTFVPDVDGEYVLRLEVYDGLFWSDPAFVAVTAAGGNRAPVVEAGANQSVVTGTVAQLDGSASTDPDGNPISYHWSFLAAPAGFTGGLNNDGIVNPSFLATVDGDYELELIVFDGQLYSGLDVVRVTASGGNLAPVADAGTDLGVDTDSVASLDGSASSDVNGDLLTYHWAFTTMPAGSHAQLNDATLVGPSFVPDLDGTYVLRLIVSDGFLFSDADTVSVVCGNDNTGPTADAGADQAVTTGGDVGLDGAGSSDPETDPLTYQWSFVALPTGSMAALNDTATVAPWFFADVNGTYTARLAVHDGELWSAVDTVDVVATGGNTAPTADAGADAAVSVGQMAQVDAVGSFDPETDPLTYEWSFYALPLASAAVLNDATVQNPSFLADRAGTYTLRLRVHDGQVYSDAAFVTLTAN